MVFPSGDQAGSSQIIGYTGVGGLTTSVDFLEQQNKSNMINK
jgi:ribosomal protein S28E/S33